MVSSTIDFYTRLTKECVVVSSDSSTSTARSRVAVRHIVSAQEEEEAFAVTWSMTRLGFVLPCMDGTVNDKCGYAIFSIIA